ncbi:MAG: cupin domain-containing protein [Chloroflexi bacterium]|nr:cupin domain-containing protein [Chloroflexota bacterium]
MRHVRRVDSALFGDPLTRATQRLLDAATGARTVSISYIQTPAGGGSPEGLHVHLVDQIFYVLRGTMSIEVAGEVSEVGPGALVVFPAGVAHRNWNAGREPTVHLNIVSPLADPDLPFATPAPRSGS